MAKESWYINESELDDFQVQIIRKSLERSFVVQGCAGSGKTILAMWKANEIQKLRKGSYYVIVFTKALRQFIYDGIREIGLNSDRVLYYEQWKNQSPEKKKADYIIVDEAQDFTNEEILEFKKNANKTIIYFGDSDQQLYGNLKSTLSMEQIATRTGLRMETLVYNHRLPKTIARFAEYIINSRDELVSRCTKEGNSKPKIYKYANLNEQYDAIIDIINSRGITDVGILFVSNKEVKAAYKYFKNKGINVEVKYNIDVERRMNLDFVSDNPKIMTYHSAKGLQFDTVFLPECYVNSENYRNALYVAITRAINEVYIMYSNNLSFYFYEIPDDLYDTNIEDQEDDEDLL